MLTKKQAQKIFGPALVNPCPTCEAEVGVLCNTPSVWVHMERLRLIQT